ncbi:MAG: sulfotransferase [Caulobacteraceae bacterium]|nr:sulfotransferase [Caulobacteraceae bacterium]
MSDALIEQRCVLVGGAPRSGTTYVQLLLYASGLFATAQESHIFPAFLGRMDEVWDRFEERAQSHRNVGLPAIISRAEFDDILRAAARRILAHIAARKPDAPWVLEKTPENVLVWPLIVRLLPRVRFITVIRDPRAVVASTIAARSWAGDWAHREVAQITESWIRSVKACLALEAAHPHVTRVRFERLRAQPANVLAGILTKFKLQVAPEKARRIVASVSLQTLKDGRFEAPWPLSQEPEEFFREGSETAWREELSVAMIALVEDLARDEMRILGYTPVARLGSVGRG